MKRLLPAALTCVLLVSACATGPRRVAPLSESAQQYVSHAGAPVESFLGWRLDSWTPIARDQLVVWTGVNEAYLLKVWDTCQDLQFAQAVALTSTTGRISKFEKVRVGRDECPIEEIRPINIKQMKVDRAAVKKAAAK